MVINDLVWYGLNVAFLIVVVGYIFRHRTTIKNRWSLKERFKRVSPRKNSEIDYRTVSQAAAKIATSGEKNSAEQDCEQASMASQDRQESEYSGEDAPKGTESNIPEWELPIRTPRPEPDKPHRAKTSQSGDTPQFRVSTSRLVKPRDTRVSVLTELMPVLITVFVLVTAIYIILSGETFPNAQQNWAFGIVGTITGFWFKKAT